MAEHRSDAGRSDSQHARAHAVLSASTFAFMVGSTWTGMCGQRVKAGDGFHVRAGDRCAPRRRVRFEAERETIADCLRARVHRRALEQHVRVLAGRADARGIDAGAEPTPLVR